MYQRLFRRKFDVTCVEDVGTAMERLEAENFAVIVSDLEMPLMTGIEFYQAIEVHHPHMAERFILHTGSPDRANGSVPIVITKGSDPDILIEAVAQLV